MDGNAGVPRQLTDDVAGRALGRLGDP
jgi:hypothetical protein